MILSVGWFITYILMFVLIGFLLVEVMAIASIVPFVHQCYAAYKISQGVDYRYPIIAERVDGERRVGSNRYSAGGLSGPAVWPALFLASFTFY